MANLRTCRNTPLPRDGVGLFSDITVCSATLTTKSADLDSSATLHGHRIPRFRLANAGASVVL